MTLIRGSTWRARISLLLFVAAVAVGLACAKGDDGTPARNDAMLTAPTQVLATAAQARDDARRRNRYAFVGDEHNRMLDEFRAELRKPGKLTDNVCEYMLEFAAKDERLPAEHRIRRELRRPLAAAVGRTSNLCAKATAASSVLPASYRTAPQEIHPDVSALASQIESAIVYATDRYDLASRLNAVVNAAASLPYTDYEIVAVTASVAQSSYEYWETNYSAFEQEVGADYGQCAQDRFVAGYNEEDARMSCMGGYQLYQSRWSWPTAPKALGVLASRLAPRCGPGLSSGFKKIAGADAKGAFGGAVSGSLAAGVGAVAGGIVGGGVGSTWASLENAWSTWWCVMKK